MSRYHGRVGYVMPARVERGVYLEEEVSTHEYSGNVVNLSSRYVTGDGTNADISLNAEFDLVADPFAYQNFQYIKYVEYMNAKWAVTSVKVERPRLILTVGGVYREQNGSSD